MRGDSVPSVSKEREGAVVGGLTLLMLLLWLGFVVHRSPRFAGSALGHSIGIAGAFLMLVPLAYSVVKRVAPLRRRITAGIPMRTLLAWHIYAGILGPLLVLLHTGHRFESPLGIALTSMTILVVLSGYVGRYLMRQIGAEIREKRELLKEAELRFEETRELISAHGLQERLRERAGVLRRLESSLLTPGAELSPAASGLVPRAARLAETRSDLEYAIRTHEAFKAWFGRWLKFHIVISFVLYALLAFHVWAAIYFGLRWL
jgi:hypothetical protein